MADHASTPFWNATGAWHGIATAGHMGHAGTGVTVELLGAPGLATLMLAPGEEAHAEAALLATYGLRLPSAARATSTGAVTIVSTGPDQYLLVDEEGGSSAARLETLPAVAGQNGGRAVLRVSGPRVRDILAKGVMIDLHPDAFPDGMAAATGIAHIPVLLWRQDDPTGASVFVIAVSRSMAGSFWRWLIASVAEFGCTIRDRKAGTGA